jgi:hypothetical protein
VLNPKPKIPEAEQAKTTQKNNGFDKENDWYYQMK